MAALATWSNGRTSRETTIQKANEAELESLQSKLDNFYSPYLQLSNTNRLIATDLKGHHPTTGQMRILLLLVDPAWKQNFKPGDIAFVEEILSIDAKLLELIQEIKRIHGRIDLIQSNPMVLHPPAAELAIPAHLELLGWPGSSGKP